MDREERGGEGRREIRRQEERGGEREKKQKMEDKKRDKLRSFSSLTHKP